MSDLEAIDAVAGAWASIDNGRDFEAAAELVHRIEQRGFTVISISQSPLLTIADALQSINKTLTKQAAAISSLTEVAKG